jgi:hypothetical protein
MKVHDKVYAQLNRSDGDLWDAGNVARRIVMNALNRGGRIETIWITIETEGEVRLSRADDGGGQEA